MERKEWSRKECQKSAWRVISSIQPKTDTSNKKLHKVFYLKMKGGYFWYLAEVACRNKKM
uniref:Uncharacterized protein n=1 Tax=Spermophilus dauricus TaxID=99837 RepID=A0A8C9P9D9_SPEDA